MRMYDNDRTSSVEDLVLLLTLDEARELRDGLEELIAKPDDNHAHVSELDQVRARIVRELTVALYGPGVRSRFDPQLAALFEE